MQYRTTEKMKKLFPNFEKMEHFDGADTLYMLDKHSYEGTSMSVDTALSLGLIEEAKKPKTVWDLKNGDYVYTIYSNGDIVKHEWDPCFYNLNYREYNGVFLTQKEAEHELIRRKMRAKAWKPEINNVFFAWTASNKEVKRAIYEKDTTHMLIIDSGLAFPTREECEKAMTQEVKEAFNLI